MSKIAVGLVLVSVLVCGCTRVKQKPIVEFDIQGLKIGDPLPERLLEKLKGDESKKDFFEVSERVKDPDMSVSYTFIDAKLEGVHITFHGPALYSISDAYAKKFGVNPTSTGEEDRWATKHGEDSDFVLSHRHNTGEIKSDKYREYYEKRSDENAKTTSKKL